MPLFNDLWIHQDGSSISRSWGWRNYHLASEHSRRVLQGRGVTVRDRGCMWSLVWMLQSSITFFFFYQVSVVLLNKYFWMWCKPFYQSPESFNDCLWWFDQCKFFTKFYFYIYNNYSYQSINKYLSIPTLNVLKSKSIPNYL